METRITQGRKIKTFFKGRTQSKYSTVSCKIMREGVRRSKAEGRKVETKEETEKIELGLKEIQDRLKKRRENREEVIKAKIKKRATEIQQEKGVSEEKATKTASTEREKEEKIKARRIMTDFKKRVEKRVEKGIKSLYYPIPIGKEEKRRMSEQIEEIRTTDKIREKIINEILTGEEKKMGVELSKGGFGIGAWWEVQFEADDEWEEIKKLAKEAESETEKEK